MTSPPRRFANTHPDVVIGNFPWYEMVWRSLRGDFKPRSEPAGGYAAFARQWTQPVDPARLAQRQQAPVITWLGHVSMLLQVAGSHSRQTGEPVDCAAVAAILLQSIQRD